MRVLWCYRCNQIANDTETSILKAISHIKTNEFIDICEDTPDMTDESYQKLRCSGNIPHKVEQYVQEKSSDKIQDDFTLFGNQGSIWLQ